MYLKFIIIKVMMKNHKKKDIYMYIGCQSMEKTTGSMIYIRVHEKELLRKKASQLGLSLSALLVAGAIAYQPEQQDVK